MASVKIFLKEVREELGKVVWPDRSQTMRLTVLVLGVSLTVGIYLSILDSVLAALIDKLIAR